MAKRYDNGKTDLALMAKDIEYIKIDVIDIKKKLDADYVTREEFQPVRNIAYGLITIVMVAVIGALLTLVIKR